MSAQDHSNPPRSSSAGAENISQREPTLADIFNAVTDIRDRVTNVEQDLAAFKQDLDAQKVTLTGFTTGAILPYQGSAFRTPPGFAAAGAAAQDVPRAPGLEHALGLSPPAAPTLQPGQTGGPYGLTPVVPEQERRFTRGRASMGVSGFPLPPQASPAPHRAQAPPQTQTRWATTPYRSAPRDSDPTLKGVKEDLYAIHQDYYRSINPSWTDDQVDREASKKTAEDYLAMRRRAIEETLAGTATPPKPQQGHQDTGCTYRRVNWDM
ncbi:unnamed protein product, partial [Tilletia controversa]